MTNAACLRVTSPTVRALHLGFTLFEVAISLGLVAFGVVSVLMLFPSGLKAQQMARFQIYAAAKAEEMIEQFNCVQTSNPAVDSEGLEMWDQPVSYRAQTCDLESKLSSHRYGIMPLPLELARRLDSDGDEIKEILDQGGYIYYSQPLASTGTEEQGAAQAPPNEAQRMIFAVKGFAQQNCIASFPMKNWPYHTPMPSPPLQFGHMADKFLPKRNYTNNAYSNYYSWPWMDLDDQNAAKTNVRNNSENFCFPWECAAGNGDPDIQKVYDWVDELRPGKHIGYFPYACGRLWECSGFDNADPKHTFFPTHLTTDATPTSTTTGGDKGEYPSRTSVLRYMACALWYAQTKYGRHPFSASYTAPGDPYAAPSTAEEFQWEEVQTFRFLAHAATCLTGWYSYSGSETECLSTGVHITADLVKFSGSGVSPQGNPACVITHDLVKYYHERSLYLINWFSAKYPNDWAVPRPLERVTMMDFPLLEADLFTPALPYGLTANPLYDSTGSTGNVTIDNSSWAHIFGRTNTDNPQQWRALSPEPIRHVGVSVTFPTNTIVTTMQQGGYDANSQFGDIDHFNLTAKFDAAERCRELVFWTADWQSYEDFETLPSAPVDASKYPFASPRCDWHAFGNKVFTQITRQFSDRLWDVQFRDEQLWSYRNPEKTLLYFNDPTNLATGTDMSGSMVLNKPWTDYPDKGTADQNRKTFNGMFGADRNYNKILDRGPVPKSVRLRATSVSRFNYYDARVQAILR
jgi:hypothetical protein